MLNGDIQIGADLGVIRQHVQQFVIGFVRIAVKDPEPVHPVDGRGLFHQGRQGGVGMILGAVAGGILGHENKLPDPLLCQGADFGQNLLLPAAAVGPADQGDGAEGAAVGAALADAHIGGIGGGSQHPAVLEIAEIILAGGDPLSFQGPADEAGELAVLIDAQEQINLRNLLEKILFVPLGQAACHHQQAAAAGFLELGHFQNGIDGFLLGGLDEAAGVDHEDIRLFGIGGEQKAVLLQEAQGRFGIHPVLVAAQGDDAYGISQGSNAPFARCLRYFFAEKYIMFRRFCV